MKIVEVGFARPLSGKEGATCSYPSSAHVYFMQDDHEGFLRSNGSYLSAKWGGRSLFRCKRRRCCYPAHRGVM